ncbi:MAG: hypothetical protein LLF94_08540 [Chlamydiales bacterium]|nr:hypothetical protein [Chlamydiales bacterium]
MSTLLSTEAFETLSQAGWTFREFEQTEMGRIALIQCRHHQQKLQSRTNYIMPKLFAAAVTTLGAIYSPITLLATAGILGSVYQERTKILSLKNKVTEFYQAQARYIFVEDVKQNIRHTYFVISTSERAQIRTVCPGIIKMWDTFNLIEETMAQGSSEQDLSEFIAQKQAINKLIIDLKTKAAGKKQVKAYETAKKVLQTALFNLNGTGDAPGILNKISMTTQNQIPRLQSALNTLLKA